MPRKFNVVWTNWYSKLALHSTLLISSHSMVRLVALLSASLKLLHKALPKLLLTSNLSHTDKFLHNLLTSNHLPLIPLGQASPLPRIKPNHRTATSLFLHR